MLDLKKLQKNFENLFEKETEDSFNEWLLKKKKEETFLLLNNKILIENRSTVSSDSVCIMPGAVFSKKTVAEVPVNTQYAMAA